MYSRKCVQDFFLQHSCLPAGRLVSLPQQLKFSLRAKFLALANLSSCLKFFFRCFYIMSNRLSKLLPVTLMFYLFFLIKKETKKSRLTDNFGNNVRLSRYILECILTLKTALNFLKDYTVQQTVLRAL